MGDWIRAQKHELAVLILAAITFFYKLGHLKLFDWDEAIYAQVSKNILLTGNWLTMHWELTPAGSLLPWFEKPPLLIWINALLYKLFGIGEFWTRLLPALAGIIVTLLVFIIAKKFYGRMAAWLSVLIMLSSYYTLYIFRIGRTDGLIMLFLYGSIYFYLLWRERRANYWWYGIGALIGLALMTKGLVALAIPGILLLTSAADGELARLIKCRSVWLAAGLALGIALPWHITAYLQNGPDFIASYFGYHVLTRAVEGIEGNGANMTFFFTSGLRGFLPWILLLPFAIGLALKDWRQPSGGRILLITVAAYFLVFSLPITKIFTYALPAYPAAAILIGSLMVNYKKLPLAYLAPIGVAIALLFSFYLIPQRLYLALWVLLILGVVLVALAYSKNLYRKATSVAVFSTLLAIASFHTTAIFKNQRLIIAGQELSRLAKNAPASKNHNSLLTYPFGISTTAIYFYSDRPTMPVNSFGSLDSIAADGQEWQLIIFNDYLGLIKKRYGTTILMRENNYSLLKIRVKDQYRKQTITEEEYWQKTFMASPNRT